MLQVRGSISTRKIGRSNVSLFYRQFVRSKAVTTVGQKVLNADCPAVKGGKISCRGKLCDTVLDWEHQLPEKDLTLASLHSKYDYYHFYKNYNKDPS